MWKVLPTLEVLWTVLLWYFVFAKNLQINCMSSKFSLIEVLQLSPLSVHHILAKFQQVLHCFTVGTVTWKCVYLHLAKVEAVTQVVSVNDADADVTDGRHHAFHGHRGDSLVGGGPAEVSAPSCGLKTITRERWFKKWMYVRLLSNKTHVYAPITYSRSTPRSCTDKLRSLAAMGTWGCRDEARLGRRFLHPARCEPGWRERGLFPSRKEHKWQETSRVCLSE